MDIASLLAAAFKPAPGGQQFALQGGPGSAPWQGSGSQWIDPRRLGPIQPAAPAVAAAAAPAAAASPAVDPRDPAGAVAAQEALRGTNAPGTPGPGKPGEPQGVPYGLPPGTAGGKPGELRTSMLDPRDPRRIGLRIIPGPEFGIG